MAFSTLGHTCNSVRAIIPSAQTVLKEKKRIVSSIRKRTHQSGLLAIRTSRFHGESLGAVDKRKQLESKEELQIGDMDRCTSDHAFSDDYPERKKKTASRVRKRQMPERLLPFECHVSMASCLESWQNCR
jgi:hypothetical protein